MPEDSVRGRAAAAQYASDVPPSDDHTLRIVAFREVRRLADLNGDLTSRDLRASFRFEGERITNLVPNLRSNSGSGPRCKLLLR
jgi:hypothetical protein